MKNYWVCRDDPFVTWRITFPPVAEERQAAPLLELVRTIVTAGAATEVCRFPDYPGTAYVDHLEQQLSDTGILPLFLEPRGGAPKAAGRLCFFEPEGTVGEAEVENTGRLLARLRPEEVEACEGLYMLGWPPVHVRGSFVRIREDARVSPTPRPVGLWIELQTDIWFPWVYGYMEEDRPMVRDDLFYDNSALALCHTPRLNRFLRAVLDAVSALGGAWEVASPEGTAKLYAPLVDSMQGTLWGE